MVRASGTYGGQVHTRFWRGNVKEKGRLEDPDVDGKTILEKMFKKYDRRCGMV